MLRLKLRKKFLKDRPEEWSCKYQKQRNVCVCLLSALVEGTAIIQEEELAKTFNKFCVSVVKNLWINENVFLTSSSETKNVEPIISKFENHRSIVTMRVRLDKNSTFSFTELDKTEVII